MQNKQQAHSSYQGVEERRHREQQAHQQQQKDMWNLYNNLAQMQQQHNAQRYNQTQSSPPPSSTPKDYSPHKNTGTNKNNNFCGIDRSFGTWKSENTPSSSDPGLWLIYQTKNGKQHGAFYSFGSNCTLKTKGQHVNGKHEGEWNFYYHSGKLKEQINYSQGKEHGTQRQWDKNGVLIKESLWINGEKQR